MKSSLKVILALVLLHMSAATKSQTLGTYPNATVISGQNATVTPGAAPTNITSVVAYTNTSFTGLLTVNPITGVVTITDAKQAGVFPVTVKAFGAVNTTATFNLTVTNPACSQGLFWGNTEVSVGTYPGNMAVGDFNGDGKQDIATIFGNKSVSIKIGDGAGGFTGTTLVSVGGNARGIAVGDFNGDGMQDFATASIEGNSVSIRLGDGLGGFSSANDVGVGISPISLAIGDFNGDGRQDIATTNSPAGINSSVSIRLGDGAGGFSGTTEVGVGRYPYGIAVGDFNGDGKQDIATANMGSDSVSIRFGDGAGGFSGTTEVGVGRYPYGLAVGDFNNDGKQDIAAVNNNSNTVSIRLGNGAGGFSGTTAISVGSDPYSIAIGDFNGDGAQDIAASNGRSAVSIRLGDGSGSFSGTTELKVGSGTIYSRNSVVVGDFNGDGRQDIAASNSSSSGGVSIRLGGAAEVNVLGNNVSIADGDNSPSSDDNTDFGTVVGVENHLERTFTIQNTGITDLTISSISSSNMVFTVGKLLPANLISPGSSATFTVSYSPTSIYAQNASITIHNDDCDESLYDFVVTGSGEGSLPPTLGTYVNTSFQTGQNITIVPNVAPANINSIVVYTNTNFSGILTVNQISGVVTITNVKQAGVYPITLKAFGVGSATSTFSLTITPPSCSQGLFTGTTKVNVGSAPQSVAIGDFNGDGRQDIAAANFTSRSVSIRLGNGDGGFNGTTNVAVGTGPKSIAVGDFNNDGNQDFATANNVDNTVSIRFGDGRGWWKGASEVEVGPNPYSIAIGDFNGDENQDFATANNDDNTVSIRFGDGIGGFTGTTTVKVDKGPRCVAIGDFNGDGKQDIGTANFYSKSVSIRLGDGAGGFTGTTDIIVGITPTSIVVGEFNGDGRQDLAVANWGSNTVSILLGKRSGGFAGTSAISLETNPFSLAVGDFNGDGKQDLAISLVGSNNTDDEVAIRLGNGGGGFSEAPNVIVGPTPYCISVGDFNGDGRQDIATGNSGYSLVAIRLGLAEEINIQGNNTNILDGDIIPSSTDQTDFGNVNIGATLIRTFTIQNMGTSMLSISSINSSNPLFALSTAPSSIAAGSSANFTVTFSPSTAGAQNATITINNNDCDEAVYDFAVTGTGLGEGIFTWYKDADNDGYSDGTSLEQATRPVGYKLAADLIAKSGDCNDEDPAIHPAQPEVCGNVKDDDCNPATSDECTLPDADNDGVPDASDCAPNDATKYQSANLYKDADNDGYDGGQENVCYGVTLPIGYKSSSLGSDCFDADPTAFPGAPELCDGKDNDCDTQVDEGCSTGTYWYFDYDNDGYGNTTKKRIRTTRPKGYVATPGDCRDWDPLSYPGAPEQPDGIDNNCNGVEDEGLDCQKTWYYDGDGDGYGADNYTWLSCKQHHNYVLAGGDCKNWDANVYPGHGCPAITEPAGNTAQPRAKVDITAEVLVFPNPARDEILVTLNGFEAGKKLEMVLMQVDGKPVATQTLVPAVKGQQVRFDVRAMSAGYYLLQVKQGGLSKSKRVIIAR